jgi:hypothetical protein
MAKRLQEARPVKSCGRRLQADAIKYEEASPMVNFRRKNIQLLGLFETKPVAGRLRALNIQPDLADRTGENK